MGQVGAAGATAWPSPPLSALAERGFGQVVRAAGAVAHAAGRCVRPQCLDRILLAVVPRDVLERARHDARRRDAERVPGPCALVAVLEGLVVVPAAEVDAVDH